MAESEVPVADLMLTKHQGATFSLDPAVGSDSYMQTAAPDSRESCLCIFFSAAFSLEAWGIEVDLFKALQGTPGLISVPWIEGGPAI